MESQHQNKVYDILISGMGIYGASILYHASNQGKQVLGIERYKIGVNDKNSSGGETRLTRQQVFEGTVYPQIAAKSQEIIRNLEKMTGEQLQFLLGALYMGKPDSKIIAGIKENERVHGLNLLTLNAQQIMEKFPAIQLPQDFIGILEEGAGFVFIEKLLQHFVNLALKNQNASVQDETELLSYVQKKDYIEVKTNRGIIRTKKLIVAQGISMVNILREFGVPIYAQKNQAAWLKWNEKQVLPGNLPVFYFDYTPKHQIYGFPNAGSGLKIGLHIRGEEYTDTRNVNNDYDRELLQELSVESKKVIKGINWSPEKIDRVKTCFYTMTQDEQFVIDFHPQNQNVVLVSACSGHGFKYAPQLGADIVRMTETNQIPYQEFRINRFKFLNQARL